jgi:two-component system response regulator HydG
MNPPSRATPAVRVLVVDDDIDMAETLAEGLGGRGFVALACSSSAEAVRRLESEGFDLLVTDLRMPGIDGLGLLAKSRQVAPERPVIVMTAYGAIETAVDAVRQGAYHYMTKPFTLDELALFARRAVDELRVRDEARRLREALLDRTSLGGLVAESPAMQEALDIARRVADAATPVLILGETGTGKTALARALHGASVRSTHPFVAVNCAALPEALLETELFGHAKGAFTGAASARQGLFLEAHGGTLLLDEVGEMSPALQAKLLYTVENGVVRPVGTDKEVTVDVRILAATHRDLRERAAAGAFRQDLLYRLDVVTIEIPALRHRREDVPLLVERLLLEAKKKHPQSPVDQLSADAMAKLLDYSWPGNVRELAHALERAVLLSRNRVAQASDLSSSITQAKPSEMPGALEETVLPIREVQRRYAAWALEKLGGHKARTADALGVDAKTLAKWLKGE